MHAVEPPDGAQRKTTERGRRELSDTSRVSASIGPAQLSYASSLEVEAEQLDHLLESSTPSTCPAGRTPRQPRAASHLVGNRRRAPARPPCTGVATTSRASTPSTAGRRSWWPSPTAPCEVLASLRDPDEFAAVFVDDVAGTIAWPNGVLDPTCSMVAIRPPAALRRSSCASTPSDRPADPPAGGIGGQGAQGQADQAGSHPA